MDQYEDLSKVKVAQICENVGYNAITKDSLNVLSDIYRRTLHQLASHCKDAANRNRRNETTFTDLAQAFNIVGINIPELKEHIQNVSLPSPFEYPYADCEARTLNRVQRNVLVDDLLEAEKNTQCEGEDDQLVIDDSGDGAPEVATAREKFLRDNYDQIFSQFPETKPVTAEKHIKLGKIKISAPKRVPNKRSSDQYVENEATMDSASGIVAEAPKSRGGHSSAGPSSSGAARSRKKVGVGKSRGRVVHSLDASMAEAAPSRSGSVAAKSRKKAGAGKTRARVVTPIEPLKLEAPPLDHMQAGPSSSTSSSAAKSSKKTSSSKSRPRVITPLDPSIAEPPSFLPILDDIKSEPMPVANDTFGSLELSIGEPGGSRSASAMGSAGRRSADQIASVRTSSSSSKNGGSSSSKQAKSSKKSKSKSGARSKQKFSISSQKVVTPTILEDEPPAGDDKEWFCPACGRPDDGGDTIMVQCDACNEWYHMRCTNLNKAPEDDDNWECELCINKQRKNVIQHHTLPKPQIEHPPPPQQQQQQPRVLTPPTVIVKASDYLRQEQEQEFARAKHHTGGMSIITNAKAAAAAAASPSSGAPFPMTTTSMDPLGLPPGLGNIPQEDLCPECNLPDDGNMMIQCDDPDCARWFHGKCVALLEEPKEDESWFCKACVDKQQSAFKRRRRK